jgi:hypothetical protein
VSTRLAELHRAARAKRAHLEVLRALVAEGETQLAEIDAEAAVLRAVEAARRPRWATARVDELRCGDRAEWPELTEGPLTVTHVGGAGGQLVEVGCAEWPSDQLVPGDHTVRVYLPRPDDEEA